MMLAQTKHIKENTMAQVNFTLKMEDIQAIIEKSGADELSKQLLTTNLEPINGKPKR